MVVLQSYQDDLEGEKSLYVEYAPKFAALAKAQGARVILYETTPATQNEKPLRLLPTPAPVQERSGSSPRWAGRIGATVVPMSTVALAAQTVRPELTLRFVNDTHLNHTMAYLTACTFYGSLFDRSPEGLPVDTITDIRFFDDDTRIRTGTEVRSRTRFRRRNAPNYSGSRGRDCSSSASYQARLLLPQCHYGIHLHGAARREIAGCGGDRDQQQRDGEEGQRDRWR